MKPIIYIERNPWNTMLYLGLLGSFLMFFILSLIFFVRAGSPDFHSFQLPFPFFISTTIMLLSSLSMQFMINAFKKEDFKNYKLYLAFTAILSFLFLYFQWIGWQQMFAIDLKWNNIASAFLLILSGLHAAHIIGGVVWLGFIWYETLRRPGYVDHFILSMNPIMATRIKLIGYYWHFVDALWIYLFLLFYLKSL